MTCPIYNIWEIPDSEKQWNARTWPGGDRQPGKKGRGRKFYKRPLDNQKGLSSVWPVTRPHPFHPLVSPTIDTSYYNLVNDTWQNPDCSPRREHPRLCCAKEFLRVTSKVPTLAHDYDQNYYFDANGRLQLAGWPTQGTGKLDGRLPRKPFHQNSLLILFFFLFKLIIIQWNWKIVGIFNG